jgi:hypothetical protein
MRPCPGRQLADANVPAILSFNGLERILRSESVADVQRRIGGLSLGGSSMSLDSVSLNSEAVLHAAPAAEQSLDQREARAAWREWIVTAVATTLAILIVAGVAVLMGMG